MRKREHQIEVRESRVKPGRYVWHCSCERAGLGTHAYPGHAEIAGLAHLKAVEGHYA